MLQNKIDEPSSEALLMGNEIANLLMDYFESLKVIEDDELFTSEELVESSDTNEVWSVARNEETEHPSGESSTTESGKYDFYYKCEIILKSFENKSVILYLLSKIYIKK